MPPQGSISDCREASLTDIVSAKLGRWSGGNDVDAEERGKAVTTLPVAPPMTARIQLCRRDFFW